MAKANWSGLKESRKKKEKNECVHSETPKYTIEFIVLQMQQSSLITCNEGMKREEWLSGHIFGTLILRFYSCHVHGH